MLARQIPDPALRRAFRRVGRDAAEVGCFAYAAAEAAYGDDECEAWRRRLVAYLRANRDHAARALESMGVRSVTPEASYLMWLDASEALPPAENAERFFLREAAVGLTGGVAFGGAPGTARLNLGCTRETLDTALERMAAAIDKVRSV